VDNMMQEQGAARKITQQEAETIQQFLSGPNWGSHVKGKETK